MNTVLSPSCNLQASSLPKPLPVLGLDVQLPVQCSAHPPSAPLKLGFSEQLPQFTAPLDRQPYWGGEHRCHLMLRCGGLAGPDQQSGCLLYLHVVGALRWVLHCSGIHHSSHNSKFQEWSSPPGWKPLPWQVHKKCFLDELKRATSERIPYPKCLGLELF